MAGQKQQGEDDGVVTSAPAAKAGNLLGDLLASAKQDMARQTQNRESASEKRAREEREAREREAALKRAQAQESLNEAARLRNEQLASAEKAARAVSDSGGLVSSKTAQHQRPQPLAESVSEPRIVQKPVNRLLLAALVLIGVGVGFGSAFALIPKDQRSDVDVGGAARALVAATSKAAAETEKRILEGANKQIDELKKQYADVQAEQKKLAADLEQARKDLELARQEMSKKSEDTKPVRKTGNGGGSSVPALRPGIY